MISRARAWARTCKAANLLSRGSGNRSFERLLVVAKARSRADRQCIYGSTTRSPGVKFSNDFSRACVGAYVQCGQSPFAWPQGSAPSDGRLEGGYRDAVRAFFQDMRMRGLGDPLLVVSDGAPGVIRAIEECFPRSGRQRCLAHRMRNLAVKVPTDLWPRVQDAGGGLLSGAVTGDRARAHQRRS